MSKNQTPNFRFPDAVREVYALDGERAAVRHALRLAGCGDGSKDDRIAAEKWVQAIVKQPANRLMHDRQF